MEELIEAFDIDRISKRPAIFDIDKLSWMNGEYLKKMSADEYFKVAKPWLEKAVKGNYDLHYIASLIQSRVDHLDQIAEMVDFIDTLADYDLEMYRHKRQKSTKESSVKVLKYAYEKLDAFDKWDNLEAIQEYMMTFPTEMGVKNGVVLWPIRTALSGKQSTPGGAMEIAYILGKEESLRRIQVGIDRLEKELA
jgi:glutamyl-tRNA synthetase